MLAPSALWFRTAFVVSALFLLPKVQCLAAEYDFRVRFTSEVHAEPFSGRTYLFFSKDQSEPRKGPNWFRPEPFVALDVANVRPGEEVVFSTKQAERMLAFPKPLAELDLAGHHVQAVLRFNPLEREVGAGAGNGYSAVETLPRKPKPEEATGHEPAPGEPLVLTVTHLVPEPEFQESKRTKLLRVRSKLLSDFHHRDIFLQAAVLLPASYEDEPRRRYPTIFTVPGFGGRHFVRQTEPPRDENAEGVEFLRVILDPSCPLGHCVFADSANNGPYGTALVTELIPEFDNQFRSVPQAEARFLTGHSSGGWATLWLQITYPDHFGGTWSTAPDSVDFRDFQRINIYRPGENAHVDPNGQPRPLTRNGIVFRDFDRMEETLGSGGQLHSFEAVFSPRGQDGKPQRLWNRATGEIDPQVAKAWEAYDLRLVLERNWPTLAPKLQGKLHIHMGDEDTFHLEGATKLLKETLTQLGSDAVVELHPGKNHGSLMTEELRDRMRSEMVAAYLRTAAAAAADVQR